MKRFALLVILALVAVSSVAQQATVDQTVERFLFLDQRLTEEEWEEATGRSDSLQFFLGLKRYLLGDPELLAALPETDATVAVGEDQRKAQLLRQMALLQRLEITSRVSYIRDSVVDFFDRTLIEFEGRRYTVGELRQLCNTESNRERRLAACRLVMTTADEIEDLMQRLVRARDQEAKTIGFNSAVGLLDGSSPISRDSLKSLLNSIKTATDEATRTVTSDLGRRLGANQVSLWDAETAGQTAYARVAGYFPVDSQVAILDRTFRGIGVDLDGLPIYFDFTSYDGIDRHATVYVFDSDYDIRVLLNLAPDFESMRMLLGAAAEALLVSQVTQDNRLFARAIPRYWRLTFVQLFRQLTMERAWLTDIANVPANLADALIAAQRERELLTVRRLLGEIDFEYNAYQNPQRNLSEVYWNSITTYLPVAKETAMPAWLIEPDFLHRPLSHQDHLLARIIAAQIGAYVDRHYGGMVNNRSARSYLVQNYLRFGSRYPWQDLLLRGTDNTLSVDAYLALIAP